MEQAVSPKKKLKSPIINATANINEKTSITCVNVPEALFDTTSAKKHFTKFGRVQKIRLFPKKHMCIVEYDQPISVERAVLNAGAFDGFMFDVTRTKARVRRRSKKDDDPDWVPDSDVEEELSAMSGAPTYRVTRKSMDTDTTESSPSKVLKRTIKQSPIKAKVQIQKKKPVIVAQPASGRESPVAVLTTQTNMNTTEAAAELNQLRSKVSLTPDEQWRILDARDRILRAWGGAGSRMKVGGATIGTCSDMCPEKELLHRQAEHQVMTLETVLESDGQLEPWRAVKQYSRSSADQEIPMCYELRPAPVLMRTCAYLLHEIADTRRPVSLADWFHFMWDRLRGIRKDITQQALCCAESIRLVEMCARFHAHCAARLADLEHTQFDQKLNTDNLTKCLQTLKHMYADVGPAAKPCEPEFRGYIALLNLGDANFWWEIKQLPLEIQKSPPITFAMKIFNALDNNNYVKFFRLVRTQATYLQASILLRYFNDVRARALARIVKAFAPRGGSKYPALELLNSLCFESIENMKSFISHYGLRFAKDESELCVILDRHQFYEDSDPYPIAREIQLIESKRNCSVGEVIAGGILPHYDSTNRSLYTSFNSDGKLKESALTAEDQGYDTKNDSQKDVKALKQEIQRLVQGVKGSGSTERIPDSKSTLFVRPESKTLSPGRPTYTFATPPKMINANKSFSFKPAIPVASTEIIKKSPEQLFGAETKNLFSFSKPQDTGVTNNLFGGKDAGNVFKPTGNSVFTSKGVQDGNNLFSSKSNENKDPFPNAQKINSKMTEEHTIFKKSDGANTIFVGQFNSGNTNGDINKNIFANTAASSKVFGKSMFGKDENSKNPSNIFGSVKSNVFANTNNIFAQANQTVNQPKPLFPTNGDISPGTLFKSANSIESKPFSIFQSKNKVPSVADNILNSVNVQKSTVYEFDQTEEQLKEQRLNEERIKEEMERKIQEQMREEEEKRQQLRRKEEEKRKEEERKKQEELKLLEEKRRKEEEKKQEELRRILEEERQAKLRRKAEEQERIFREKVDKESAVLIDEILNETIDETVIEVLLDEMEKMKNLVAYAGAITEEICTELCDEISRAETLAEKFWTAKLEKKWFNVWKSQYKRNFKRRRLLDDTPVWLSEKTHVEKATRLRRLVENVALKNMNAIHRGYKFIGELKQLPAPEPFNIMEIIRSPLLKRMKHINYPYDKCFFWKVTLVSPGENEWIYRKINIENWLLDAFSDGKTYDTSESLIHLEKQSWNHLMDFGISVTLTSLQKKNCSEALEGTNGLLFFVTEKDNFVNSLQETLKQKYPYQNIPIALIMPEMKDSLLQTTIEQCLVNFVNKNMISAYNFFYLDGQNISISLITSIKSALKWMAKKYPPIPPLEVDYLKSICQRYLGNEIWCRLRSERDGRMQIILKDLPKLVDCYNVAVDKLTKVITNEDLFNHPCFPLEFNAYLDHTSPFPKPYEFIPTNARNSNNIVVIMDIIKKLKLPQPVQSFQPTDVASLQSEMRRYCKQIGWFEDPDKVVCKIVAKLPTQFADIDMPCDQFSEVFEYYDLIDFLNILVYEKICGLQNFDNRFAIYEKGALEDYRNLNWLYEVDVMSKMKHKPLEYEDDLDNFIQAKRRKIAMDSMEYLMLEDNDCTMVEDNIKAANKSISKYSNCKTAVKQLELQIDLEKKKSMELENLLKSALSDL